MSEVIYTNIDKYCDCGYHFNINGKSEKEVVKEYLAMIKQHENTEQHKEWLIRNTKFVVTATTKCSCGEIISAEESYVGYLSDENKRNMEISLGRLVNYKREQHEETKQHKRILKLKKII